MVEMTFSMPLKWPPEIPITWNPKPSRFGEHSLSKAIDFVRDELGRYGAESSEMSADWSIGVRGFPLADNRNGYPVALRYSRNGKEFTIAICEYNQIVDNIWAIGKVIEALRTMERHGGDAISRQAESAFSALPEPDKPWWRVFGLDENEDAIVVQAKYRSLAKKLHPDNGGSTSAMAELNKAWDEFKKTCDPEILRMEK